MLMQSLSSQSMLGELRLSQRFLPSGFQTYKTLIPLFKWQCLDKMMTHCYLLVVDTAKLTVGKDQNKQCQNMSLILNVPFYWFHVFPGPFRRGWWGSGWEWLTVALKNSLTHSSIRVELSWAYVTFPLDSRSEIGELHLYASYFARF